MTLPSQAGPGVHIAVHAVPKPGKQAQYERVLGGLLAQARSWPGCISAGYSRAGAGIEVTMAFDTPQHYHAWETSAERHRWARQLPELLAGSTESRRLTGLAAWVVDPAQPLSSPPPRWKTAVATWLGIFPTVVILVALIRPMIPPSRFLLLGNLPVTILCTILMTYIVMPAITHVLGHWLLEPGAGETPRRSSQRCLAAARLPSSRSSRRKYARC